MKSFIKSKTVWFNFLALATIIAGNFGYGQYVPAAWVNDLGVSVVLIVNLILRFMTKGPVSLSFK